MARQDTARHDTIQHDRVFRHATMRISACPAQHGTAQDMPGLRSYLQLCFKDIRSVHSLEAVYNFVSKNVLLEAHRETYLPTSKKYWMKVYWIARRFRFTCPLEKVVVRTFLTALMSTGPIRA
eukprot:TRINITY_DN15891_c1_g1_i1.p1 TRINITY_DN15891_c1_g1~~TRINITY_DN15891_c1_g1_i1.p1  ORF type:complete len:135 (-),score=1.61 TRINITY_DN15891_c1_g1_i1:121-489(-)